MTSKYIKLPPEIISSLEAKPLFRDLAVFSTGYRVGDSKIGWHTKKEATKNAFFHYCLSGEGWIAVGGERQPIAAGDLIICRPHLEHTYGTSKENPWETRWVYFQGDLIDAYIDLIDSNSEKPIILKHMDAHRLRPLMEILRLMEKGYAEIYMLHAANVLKSLLTSVSYQSDAIDTLDHKLENLMTYMMANIDQNLSLDQLASIMSMSKDYFTKVFYRRYGYTPIDYFIRMKIQEACHLLTTTDKTIKEIGLMLGYGDSLYFSRVFKKKCGYPPSDYRKLVL